MKEILAITIFVLLICVSGFAQNEISPCPQVVVFGPNVVLQSGEPMVFSASVQNEKSYKNLKYNWSIDKGTIIKGQGTNVIEVSTEGLSDTTLTATTQVELPGQQCESIDSETGVVAPIIEGQPVDSYNNLSTNDELSRFDAYIITIAGYERKDYGFVVIGIKEKEISNRTKKRLQRLVKYLDSRKFPRERIVFAIDKSSYDRTILWIVPRDAKLPKCENCKIIKASEIN